MYKKEYENVKLIGFLKHETGNGGFCPVCSEFCYIPACTKLTSGQIFNCFNCSCIVAKTINIKIIEEEI